MPFKVKAGGEQDYGFIGHNLFMLNQQINDIWGNMHLFLWIISKYVNFVQAYLKHQASGEAEWVLKTRKKKDWWNICFCFGGRG